MTDLNALVPALKREVAVPGTFDSIYTTTQDSDLTGSLMDAFAAAQLDGFFLQQQLDGATAIVTPDLSLAAQALIVAYAGERIITTQILNLRQRVRYEAGPVKYEIENSTYILVQLLKNLAERRKQLMQANAPGLGAGALGSGFAMGDMFIDREFPFAALSAVAEDFPTMMYSYEVLGY